MRCLALIMVAVLTATSAAAETLVAAQLVRSRALITAADLRLAPGEVAGALSAPDEAIGMEARIVLYPGRPIRPGDIGPPAVIERNQIVTLVYLAGALTITAEGRALDRAGVGDRLRVLNTTSKTSILGTVAEDGSVRVEP